MILLFYLLYLFIINKFNEFNKFNNYLLFNYLYFIIHNNVFNAVQIEKASDTALMLFMELAIALLVPRTAQ